MKLVKESILKGPSYDSIKENIISILGIEFYNDLVSRNFEVIQKLDDIDNKVLMSYIGRYRDVWMVSYNPGTYNISIVFKINGKYRSRDPKTLEEESKIVPIYNPYDFSMILTSYRNFPFEKLFNDIQEILNEYIEEYWDEKESLTNFPHIAYISPKKNKRKLEKRLKEFIETKYSIKVSIIKN